LKTRRYKALLEAASKRGQTLAVTHHPSVISQKHLLRSAKSRPQSSNPHWFERPVLTYLPHMSESYYKTINGVRYDKGILDAADRSVAGQGDGRISLDDAKMMMTSVKDGGKYTDTEKATIAYVRDNYKFTTEADDWFRTEIRKWAATK